MINYFYSYITALVAMAVIDFVWLTRVAPAFYTKHIGSILAEKTNTVAAVLFYLIFILGVTYFVVYPSWSQHRSLLNTALLGALFGFVTYATYDLTNNATVKNWPAIVTIVDMTWGTILVSAVSVVSVLVLNKFIH